MLGVNGAFGNSQLFSFRNTLDGVSSFDATSYYAVGIDYSRTLSKHWEICTGIMYGRNKIMENGITHTYDKQHYQLENEGVKVGLGYRF